MQRSRSVDGPDRSELIGTIFPSELLLTDWTPMFEALDVDDTLNVFMRVWDAIIDLVTNWARTNCFKALLAITEANSFCELWITDYYCL